MALIPVDISWIRKLDFFGNAHQITSVCRGQSKARIRASTNVKLFAVDVKPQDGCFKSTMSFYFAIIGTRDNPLFEHEFGSSKQGGDGVAKFPEQARHMNQFIVHSSLDIVEEVQWASGQM